MLQRAALVVKMGIAARKGEAVLGTVLSSVLERNKAERRKGEKSTK
jgi:hypothetical protein